MTLRTAALLACLAGCSGGGDSAADSAQSPPDYEADVQGVLDRSCVSCHNEAGTYDKALPVALHLEPGRSYDALVGADSVQLPSMRLVEPGDADASYLWRKLNDTHEAAGGAGDEMPPGLTLAANELDPIRAWIEAGAPR